MADSPLGAPRARTRVAGALFACPYGPRHHIQHTCRRFSRQGTAQRAGRCPLARARSSAIYTAHTPPRVHAQPRLWRSAWPPEAGANTLRRTCHVPYPVRPVEQQSAPAQACNWHTSQSRLPSVLLALSIFYLARGKVLACDRTSGHKSHISVTNSVTNSEEWIRD